MNELSVRIFSIFQGKQAKSLASALTYLTSLYNVKLPTSSLSRDTTREIPSFSHRAAA